MNKIYILLKNLQIKSIILIIFVLFLISPQKEVSDVVTFKLVPEKNCHNVKIITIKSGKNAYSVSDLSYQNNKLSLITDIVLSFNYSSSNLISDDTKQYKVKYSNYFFQKGQGALGNGCAKFFKRGHKVEVETVRNSWLGSCNDLGSFTIEFRFMPHAIRDGSTLFSRIGYLSGSKRGIEIKIKNGRIIASLYRIFEKHDSSRVDMVLNKGRILQKGKWYHFVLSFDRISGKLVKYINGEEEDVVYTTKNGIPFEGVFTPNFGYRNRKGELICIDAPLAVIGENYSGKIDEFRISYRHFDDLKLRMEIASSNYKKLGIIGRLPYNIEGIVASPVYSFPATGTKITIFKWKEILKKDTFIWMEFRISDHLFYENDTELKWYRIKKNQRKIFLSKRANGEYLRGKYYQWRAHLIPSPDGKYSPLIYNIHLNYQLDQSPNPPKFLEVVETGDQFVRIKWKKNVDSDILGYRIYYGINSKRYDGIISYVNGKRLTNSFSKSNYIEVKINNQLIEENRMGEKRKLLNFPFFRNTVLYYFSVSAYDSYKPDSPYNHESDLSKQISARPFAGSEID